MPELPDVEAFRQVLMTCGRHRRVTDIEVRDAGVLRGVTETRLRRELKGRHLGKAWRHGKWLFVPTDGDSTLVCHFGMTGSLRCCCPDEPIEPHDRIVLTLDDAQDLRYRDQRKLQGVRLADEYAVDRILDGLGPDALTVDRAEFRELLSGRRGAVKSALMDQSMIAGLGNLLCDEILWRARVHPRFPARELSETALRRIHSAMGRVLETSVRAGCVPPRRSWLTGRRDDSEPLCPRCGRPLYSSRVAGRRTVWCPGCQPSAAGAR
ncbi:Fpg/Nei family DNA glycosylase [Streptomyces chiangmaiensis]|uniref:DNA-formamidopyrimidine glycosylase family protein n=1 Tax=Streptomyces chiangmaiensis TaxID=766497 RepID=A0ABU7FI49_9ACTN|nr:DNA-formamidopyrimidine glycosylase family protein [Streptomyces chiangmaiensis]MED7823038.1 DNA-formamidopyrimidine glycosylase family protein [Streptomyces chiangmaiensis]